MPTKYLLLSLLLIVPGYSSFSQDYRPPFIDEGRADEMSLRYITPRRIVWISDEAGVRDPHNLLKDFPGQVSVASRDVCTLTTTGGAAAGVLLDFGREYQGGIRISAGIRPDKTPLKVRVRFGESVAEAMSDCTAPEATAGNDHALRDFEIAVPWLGTVSIGESGFRFVRLDLLEEDAELPLAGVSLAFRYRDVPYLGSFECSDTRLNDIWMTGAYTVHLNMQDYLLEGVKRDRLVWLGDLHPEVMCVNTVFGDNPVVKKSLDFARDDTPLPGWMNGMCSYSLWWIIIHKDYYLYRGDREYLLEQMPYLRGLVSQILQNIDGSRERFNGGTRFLDWPTSEMPEVVHAGLQAMAVMSLDAARSIAVWTGDKALEEECAHAVDKLRMYTPRHVDNKQAASLLSVAGLMGRDKAADIVARGGAAGFSTFYGYYMLEALAAAGRIGEAQDIISAYWGGMLDLGATTFWEDLEFDDLAKASRIDELIPEGGYDIHGMGGAYCYEGFRHSLCHGWASGPTSWLTMHVLGVRPLEPGFSVVEIRPDLGSLTWVHGTVPTPYGTITVCHTKGSDGNITTQVDVPQGVMIAD